VSVPGETVPRELPMFPLGSTVFPSQVVPLHIFEDRYRTLISEITADDHISPFGTATFGVALIDRGHEVGGGDHRVSVGTRVEVLQAEEFEDGRWGVVVAGVERIDVLMWLADDPYPRAHVNVRTVADTGGGSLSDVEALLTETIALLTQQAGIPTPDPYVFDADPHMRLDQMSALAPLTDFDRQQLLEAATTTDQISQLATALEEKLVMLHAQLGEN